MTETGAETALRRVLPLFETRGTCVGCVPYGCGHINLTYRVWTDTGAEYILQKINGHVFRDIPGLMENITRVTAWLRRSCTDSRRVLTLVPAANGDSYILAEGEAYRLYVFVADHVVLQRADNDADLRTCAGAFGHFLMQLRDFPASTLHEVIPRFHDPADRLRTMSASLAQDRAGRARECRKEADFLLERQEYMDRMTRMRDQGLLPVRVTHNDTKVNNVLLDRKTREGLCVVALDTVMPGLAGHDFGDTVRSGASLTGEDSDPDRPVFSMERFGACASGFLSACGQVLTREEKETLADGALLMTLEVAVRFLTDYLDGDVYFRISDPTQNLRRARNQIRLAAEMEANMDDMRRTVRQSANG